MHAITALWQGCQHPEKAAWFMDNVSVWRLYDSEDSDTLADCSEEDLLLHYRHKQQVGG